MMIKTTVAFFIFALSTFSAQAEQIIVPVGQQAAYNQQLERPRTGQSTIQVEEKYGQPISQAEAVGEPPISSWEYEKFTVFFEYDHVIHSVLKVDTQLLD